MQNSEKVFADGIFFNDPHEKAPEFIIGSISFSKARFLTWLDNQAPDEKDYVKLDVKRSKEGKIYCELNTYTPNRVTTQPRPQNEQAREDDVRIEDVPF